MISGNPIYCSTENAIPGGERDGKRSPIVREKTEINPAIIPYPQEGKIMYLQDVHAGKKSVVVLLPFVLAMILMLSCSIVAPAATTTPIKTNTPEITATKKATPDKTATEKVHENQTSTAQAELTDVILGEIETKLDEVGVSMRYGNVIFWYPHPIEIESSQHNLIQYQLLDSSIEAADFAFHTTIKWETKQKSGIVNCIIMFRIEDDINIDGWYAMRIGLISGAPHIWFQAFQGWDIVTESSGYYNKYIHDAGVAENEVVLIAQGVRFDAYLNGHPVDVWWGNRVDSGAFGLGIWQDTGTSVCTFSDNWILSWN
jgi:hypothetical protein